MWDAVSVRRSARSPGGAAIHVLMPARNSDLAWTSRWWPTVGRQPHHRIRVLVTLRRPEPGTPHAESKSTLVWSVATICQPQLVGNGGVAVAGWNATPDGSVGSLRRMSGRGDPTSVSVLCAMRRVTRCAAVYIRNGRHTIRVRTGRT
jgi:hypothetical protein